jgi:hypothetical protein
VAPKVRIRYHRRTDLRVASVTSQPRKWPPSDSQRLPTVYKQNPPIRCRMSEKAQFYWGFSNQVCSREDLGFDRPGREAVGRRDGEQFHCLTRHDSPTGMFAVRMGAPGLEPGTNPNQRSQTPLGFVREVVTRLRWRATSGSPLLIGTH